MAAVKKPVGQWHINLGEYRGTIPPSHVHVQSNHFVHIFLTILCFYFAQSLELRFRGHRNRQAIYIVYAMFASSSWPPLESGFQGLHLLV